MACKVWVHINKATWITFLGFYPTGNFFQDLGRKRLVIILNERRWEEYSLECCLTGFPELGVISGHYKHFGQHRADFSLSGKSGHRRWGNRHPTRNLKKNLKYRNGISRAGADIQEGRIAP